MAKKLLVVDDNVSVLKQIGALLGDRYELFLAKSGPMALKISNKEKPDFILLDIEMPEMDGFETLAQFRGDPRFSGIPVVFLTGNSGEEAKQRALESGAADLITKPVDKDLLLDRIESLLGPQAADNGQPG
jgi:CheY-like chemotaxis protein